MGAAPDRHGMSRAVRHGRQQSVKVETAAFTTFPKFWVTLGSHPVKWHTTVHNEMLRIPS